MCSVIPFDRLRTGVDDLCLVIPLLCKEGPGEVEAFGGPGDARLLVAQIGTFDVFH